MICPRRIECRRANVSVAGSFLCKRASQCGQFARLFALLFACRLSVSQSRYRSRIRLPTQHYSSATTHCARSIGGGGGGGVGRTRARALSSRAESTRPARPAWLDYADLYNSFSLARAHAKCSSSALYRDYYTPTDIIRWLWWGSYGGGKK